MEFTKTEVLAHCANAACPNKVGQGLFVLLESEENIVGGHRKLKFFMCAPCAAAFTTNNSNVRVGGPRA